MRALLLFGFAVLAMACPARGWAQNGSIGVYADSAATLNAAELTQGVPTTLYIIAHLEGATSIGLLGAEFRVTGLPDDWVYSATRNPASNVSLGDPFRPQGPVWRANLAFPQCQSQAAVLLYTVTVVPTSQVTNVSMTVEAGSPPSNPNRDYPLINICDAPAYTPIEVTGRTFIINPTVADVDFAVSSCDLRVLGSSAALLQPVLFQALVHNVGVLNAVSTVHVRFLLDGNAVGPDVPAGPIASGASVPVIAWTPWLVDFDPHQLTVVIDPEGVHSEVSRTNNTATALLPYDLRVESIPSCAAVPPRMFSDCEPCPGDSITLSAVVTNSGLLDAQSVVVEFRETSGGSWFKRETIANVAAQSSCSTAPVNVSTAYSITAPGLRTLEVSVDPDDSILETDESNNELSRTLNVTCVPDLWFDYLVTSCDMTVSNPSPLVGQEIDFLVTVQNIGSLDAPDTTTAHFALDGQPFGDVVPVEPIPSGGSVVISPTSPWVVDFASHSLTVVINANSALGEQNYSNNSAQGVLPVDFTIATVRHCPGDPPVCQPCSGDTVRFDTIVSNAGMFDADSVTIALERTFPTVVELGRIVVPSVPARTQCTLPVVTEDAFSYVTLDGVNLLYAHVDPDNEWSELQEQDNSSSELFVATCANGIDLIVVALVPIPEVSQPGGVLDSVLVAIRNTGTVAAADVQGSLFVDNDALCPVLLFGDIPAGATRVAMCTTAWSIPNDPSSSHTLTACADPADLITELNESNNCRLEILVGGGATPVALTDFVASSMQTGVTLHWRSWADFTELSLDRRVVPTPTWERVAELPPHSARADGYVDYRYVDTGVPVGAEVAYRVIGHQQVGDGIVLGETSIVFQPPLPNELVLYPSRPNPFNPSTQILLSLPRSQPVDVRILDSSGRLVKLLWNGVLERGPHGFTWNGDDAQGGKVTSGIYFCTVRSEGGRHSRKLVLLK